MSELTNWIEVIGRAPKTGWAAFYKAMLHHPVSNIDLLLWAVDTYGNWVMVDAIMASATKKFDSDPFGYVMTVARAKWREENTRTDSDAQYERGLERAKNRIKEQNEEMEAKLERARRLHDCE